MDEDQMIKLIWPHEWEPARQHLVKLGYQVQGNISSA